MWFYIFLGLIACVLVVRTLMHQAPMKARSDDNANFYRTMEQAGVLPEEWHDAKAESDGK